MGPAGRPDTEMPEETRRCQIENKLRLWGPLVFGGLLVGLTLFDVVDNTCLGGHYEGPPGWLIGSVTGILATLFIRATLIRRS